ncbi:MAG: peptide chain release factor N(5)-glutamine methyltransferase [Chlamydiia bacterium]|nr:peptide chain release factor N(5)-glutamine methyltransferase [Chlamydiia bacterium]
MKTTLELLELTESYLRDKQISSPKVEAQWLLAQVLKMDRLQLYTDAHKPVTESEVKKLRAALKRRGAREPLQYIIGETDFFNLTLKVTPDVLIPRPETEVLVEKILQAIPEDSNKVFWDICSGSGAIGLSVKKARPNLKVVLSDISNKALAVAKENAKINELEVEFLEGDLFFPFSERRTDFIASNPPYVSEKDYLTLEPEVREFEPKLALVGRDDGWEFYKRFEKECRSHLNPEAMIWLELGPENTKSLFENPFWEAIKEEVDYAGHSRYLTARQNPLNFK